MKVRMVTSDNLQPTKAIVLECGILTYAKRMKEGWDDGGSIAFAVILLLSGQNEEERNIYQEGIRGGRRVEISMYEIVVGDDVLPTLVALYGEQ
ncbi:PREDICTED: calcium-transporting ATPase 8, plasma membrane-type-like [Tarenaya hassleriana]|uniref:calcium-transporting ATPase 8, plasma membrane-type-like n=1 Tax=Tarenaya hassleriana TaxID=28532 RepID=UPI00053C1278|nr:PREDICTED: calcium-transporting ATPase 8, plasma membrane-type-like [Tarenaya hassleriana]